MTICMHEASGILSSFRSLKTTHPKHLTFYLTMAMFETASYNQPKYKTFKKLKLLILGSNVVTIWVYRHGNLMMCMGNINCYYNWRKPPVTCRRCLSCSVMIPEDITWGQFVHDSPVKIISCLLIPLGIDRLVKVLELKQAACNLAWFSTYGIFYLHPWHPISTVERILKVKLTLSLQNNKQYYLWICSGTSHGV